MIDNTKSKAGRPKVYSDVTRLTVSVDKELKDKLEILAKETERSVSYIVNKMIRQLIV